jgi:hypothetical protein
MGNAWICHRILTISSWLPAYDVRNLADGNEKKVTAIPSSEIKNKDRRQKRAGLLYAQKKKEKSLKRRERKKAEARGETVRRWNVFTRLHVSKWGARGSMMSVCMEEWLSFVFRWSVRIHER